MTASAAMSATSPTQPSARGSSTSACAEHGRLDAVVNNAGMVSATEPDTLGGDIDATDPDRWRRSISRNLDTAYFVTRAAMAHLRASGSGRIVFVSSVTGAAMGMRHEVGYAASKAALVGLARGLAVDEGRHGVTANVVGPGWIATGLADRRRGRRRARRHRSAGRAAPRRWRRRSPSW